MQVNDFVTIQYHSYKAIAYTVEIGQSTCRVVKVYYEYPTGSRFRYTDFKEETVQRYQVKPMDTERHEEDVEVLINLSLDSGDKDWFEELMRG
jgi:2-methylcitrate dehydratase PrpD